MIHANVDPSLTGFLRKQLPSTIELLRQMVEINSFTANRSGVRKLAEFTARIFQQLGFAAEFVPADDPELADHLVLIRKGRSGQVMGIVSHLDTVYPPVEEQRNDFHWRPSGDNIYGPGTMDIKGGTAMIHLVLSALQAVARDVFEETTWIILLNSSEEVLSHDFGRLCLDRLGRKALAALVFEAGAHEGDAFTVVTARKGRAVFRLTVHGRGAHAGGDHERGANAVVQVSETIRRIAALTDYANDLTFNVGNVSGGTVVNRVPHLAVAEIEMRAFDRKEYERGKSAILALNGPGIVRSEADGHACQIEVELVYESPPWPSNEETERLFRIWQQTGHGLGLSLMREQRGGLSDGNLLWHAIPTLDGLGPHGGNAHCSEQSADGTKEQEFVDVSSFVPKAALNTLAIMNCLKNCASTAPHE